MRQLKLPKQSAEPLSLRLTHTYVGTYAHLDKWAEIGTLDVIGLQDWTIEAENEQGDCSNEPQRTVAFVRVTEAPELHEMWIECAHDPRLDYSAWANRTVARALRDTYSRHGCAHEHDCCGCRSFSAEAERYSGDVWRVTINSSRNY